MLIGRLSLVVVATTLGALSVPALAQGSLHDQLTVCARINKDKSRLECYDSVARAAGQSGGGASFGASSMPAPSMPAPPMPANRPALPPAPAPQFGSEQIARSVAERRADDGGSEIAATITASRDNGLGVWQFDLSDGAIWRMTERASTFRPPAPNEAVTIRKGALGSYLMQVGRQPAVRVARVR